jgi:hypothetical protein
MGYASDLSHRLAEQAEAVCKSYLPSGRRQGRYWIVGNVRGAKGQSLYVKLFGEGAGRWTEYVAPRVMLRPGDRASFRGRSTAPAQHNLSTLGRVA